MNQYQLYLPSTYQMVNSCLFIIQIKACNINTFSFFHYEKNMKALCENVTSIFERASSRKREKVPKVKFPVNHFNYVYSFSWYVLMGQP